VALGPAPRLLESSLAMSAKGKTIAPVENAGDLNELVFQDDLTRINNRRFFYRYLKEKIPWGEPRPEPVSLLMIDLDHFKQINDRYGHLEGDGALVHVADLLREQVGDRGHVVRYAGDEFAVLLPGSDLDPARELAASLLGALRSRSFHVESVDKDLTLTLSVGVAAFPDHGADPRKFIEAADRALYVSKRLGRNRVTVVGDDAAGALEDVRMLDLFPARQAIGQDPKLEVVRGILDATGNERNTVVLVRGLPGTGKTRFLQGVEEEGRMRDLSTWLVRCEERDAAQSFGLVGRILEGFASTIPADHRSRGLPDVERRAIEHVSPTLFGGDGSDREDPPTDLAPALLAGAVRLLTRVAARRPLLLLADDLHEADLDSLRLLGELLRERRVPCILCGTVRERTSRQETHVRSALGLAPHREYENLALVETKLAPFTPTQVGQLVRSIFAGIRADRGVLHRIWDLTKGNPLHTEELLKSFLRNEFLVPDGAGWRFADAIPWDDLPATLEEAVGEDLGALDVETAAVLARAAALGTRFRRDALGSILDLGESRILEILDRGVDANVLRRVRALDDDEFEFVSSFAKEVQESRIDEELRRRIHERIADYEERANAASIDRVYGRLRYHYDRSENEDKAARYSRLLEEADRGTPEPDPIPAARRARARIQEADVPLSVDELVKMRNVLRFFSAALKSRLLYPPGSRMITESTRHLFGSMQEVFRTCRVFTLASHDDDMLINGVKVDPRQFVTGNREFLSLLKSFNIQSITITRDVELRELEGFRDLLHERSRADSLDHDYWNRNLDRLEIRHISVDQRVYVVAGSEPEAGLPEDEEPPPDAQRDGSAEGEGSCGVGAGVGEVLESALDSETHGELDEVLREIVRLLETGSPREKRVGIELLEDLVQRLVGLKEADRLLDLTEQMLDSFDDRISERSFGAIARVFAGGVTELLKRGRNEAAVRIVRFLSHQERREGAPRAVIRDARRALQSIIGSPSFDLIIADLTSEDPERQADSREVLLAFHSIAIPRLIQVIKETDEYRTRKFTALVLNEIGEDAVEDVRRELAADAPDDEYRRLLGILDTFPADFADQIVTALCHPNPVVRAEAAKLLKKIRGDIQRILLDALGSGEGSVITEAIVQLGRLRAKEAVQPILEKLGAADVPDPVVYEGCLALGRIGDARAVELLERVLTGARRLFRRRHHSARVRFAAAWALSQIDAPESREVLRKVVRDRDTEIRALASRTLR